MKNSIVKGLTLGILALLTIGASPSRASPADERLLRDSVGRLEQAWNSADAGKWAAEYWPDGELINILGTILPGVDEVRDRTAQILAGPFKGSHFSSEVRQIRFVGTDAAVVDTDIRVTHYQSLPGAISASEPGVLLTRMKHVYERRNGRWLIIASQNTSVIPRH
jgi:uncharacterized protein (TIGR02246 family)